MKFTSFTDRKPTRTVKENAHNRIVRRQSANYERFMQERADVFRVAETKAQAMFWTMQ